MTQEEALDLMKMGKNVYLTGPAGSGKTFVLRAYINWLRDRGIFPAVTASTGIAATHLGGRTIHSWSGIGIRDKLSERDLDKLEQRKSLYERINSAQVLIIDEISMLAAHQFDMIEHVLRALRRRDEPFGGLQVVLSGDFFQLPPIAARGKSAQFVTESHAWQEGGFGICYLDTQYRHDDSKLVSLLNEIRGSAVSEKSRGYLDVCSYGDTDTGENITRLYTHNVDVDRENDVRLENLSGKEQVYIMEEKGKRVLLESLKAGCLAPEALALKIGAEVMFVKNDPQGLYVNGTRGKVVDYKNSYPVIKTLEGKKIVAEPAEWHLEEEGRVLARITQVPLRLAWAITVHKSQGMTLDSAIVDLSESFVAGQGYVALSRVRRMTGLKILGLNRTALSVDPRVSEIDRELVRRSHITALHLRRVRGEKILDAQKAFIESIGGTNEVRKGRRKERPIREDTYTKTKKLLEGGLSVFEIAQERGMNSKTIWGHLEALQERGELPNLEHMSLEDRVFEEAKKAFDAVGLKRLKPAREHILAQGREIDYENLRLVRLKIRNRQ